MSLLERFQADTKFHSVGHFVLDESRARSKMSRYQLVQVEEFALLVVQAMVAAECSAIELEWRPPVVPEGQGKRVAPPGRIVRIVARDSLLDGEALSHLDEYLFDSSSEALPYHLLGVAANALETSCLERPRIVMDGDDLVFEAHLKAELVGLSSLLRDRLVHLGCPFLLQGSLLASDPLGAEPRVTLSRSDQTEIVLLRYGVIVDRKRLSLPINARAVVNSPSLRLDASYSQVVEDDAYHQVVATVRDSACERLAGLAREHQPGGPDETLLFGQLFLDLPEPAASALKNCPLFPLADRKDFRGLAQLLDEVAIRGKLMVSERRYNLQLDLTVVLQSEPRIASALKKLVGANRLVNAEDTFRQKQQIERNRQRWESQPRPTQLSPGVYLARSTASQQDWEAELGFLAAPGGASSVDVLYQGRLLFSEPLTGVPPSAVVVVNFKTAKINETWTRIDGRQYRAALKAIQGELETLFSQQSFDKPSDLYPELRDHLLAMLSLSKDPPEVIQRAPLFTVIGQNEPLSLVAVSAMGRVAMGDVIPDFSRVPKTMLPEPLLLYSDRQFRALRERLGRNNVEDVRQRQQRLSLLDQQMANPQKPELPLGDGETLKRRALDLPGVRGQMELNSSSTSDVEVTFLKFGAVVEQRMLKVSKVLGWRIILEADVLELNENWDGVTETDAYRALLGDLETFGVEFERSLLHQAETSPSIYLRLLLAYPQPVEVYRQRPLFLTSEPDRLCSLAELTQDLERHGHLLRGDLGSSIAGRVVVCQPSKQVQALLDNALDNPPWRNSADVFKENEQRERFLQRSVVAEIRLNRRCPVRLPLSLDRGEVALLSPSDASEGGVLHCYFEGRLVASLTDLLPKYCLGAIESDRLLVSQDYSKVSVPLPVRQDLLRLCSEAMLLGAQHRDATLRLRALEYFASIQDREDGTLQSFAEQFTVPIQGAQKRSLAELQAQDKISGYVPLSCDPRLPARGTVLRLRSQELGPVSKLLGQKLSDVEAQLTKEARLRSALAALPTTLPTQGMQRSYANEDLSADIAMSNKPWAVAFDSDGQALGRLDLRGLPVAALVTSGRAKRGRSGTDAELPRPEMAQLREWAEALCLEWVEDLSHRPASRQDVQMALNLLNGNKREIGSDSDRPGARIAALLWELPLFECTDRTWVSGLSIVSRFQDSRTPVVVAESRWRAPEGSLLAAEPSLEREILRSLLGKAGVHPFETPPLVDAEDIGESIKRLVAWGLTPIGTAMQKIGRVMNDPGPIVKTSKKKPREISPEERLMTDLRQDVTNLLGRQQVAKSDGFFQDLEYGIWVLGPPIYRDRNRKTFKINQLHPSVRWLLASGGDRRSKRIARTLLVINWVSLVNVASEELTDEHEDAFLIHLAERMAQTFAEQPGGEETTEA